MQFDYDIYELASSSKRELGWTVVQVPEEPAEFADLMSSAGHKSLVLTQGLELRKLKPVSG